MTGNIDQYIHDMGIRDGRRYYEFDCVPETCGTPDDVHPVHSPCGQRHGMWMSPHLDHTHE